jgi:hypothetical protein
MAKSKTKFFEIIVSQARQNFEVDIVLREHLRVLAEAKSFEPLGDVTQAGPPRDGKRYRSRTTRASKAANDR